MARAVADRAGLALLAAWAVIFPADLPWLVAEPLTGTGAVQKAINTGINAFVTSAKPILRMISDGINWAVRGLQWGFHSLPWPCLVIITAFIGWWFRGMGLALFVAIAVLYMALSGHWIKSMNTLAMVGVAVPWLSVLASSSVCWAANQTGRGG